MKQIEPLRKEIDLIDSEIVKLLNQRMEVVRKIRIYKQKNDLPIEDLTREEEIIKNIDTGKLDDNYIREIYRVIFRHSKKFQK